MRRGPKQWDDTSLVQIGVRLRSHRLLKTTTQSHSSSVPVTFSRACCSYKRAGAKSGETAKRDENINQQQPWKGVSGTVGGKTRSGYLVLFPLLQSRKITELDEARGRPSHLGFAHQQQLEHQRQTGSPVLQVWCQAWLNVPQL